MADIHGVDSPGSGFLSSIFDLGFAVPNSPIQQFKKDQSSRKVELIGNNGVKKSMKVNDVDADLEMALLKDVAKIEFENGVAGSVNEQMLDWFELMQIPWTQAILKVVKQIVIHLKPQDRIAMIYLLVTFPLCFYATDVYSMVWSGIFFRLFLIPTVIYFRSFCVYTTTSLGKSNYWYRLKLKGRLIRQVNYLMGTLKRHPEGEDTLEITIGWVDILYRVLDWYVVILFVTLYTETGQLIENLHGSGRYDSQLQQMEEGIFHGQPSTSIREWYPFLNSKVLGEYLHMCYFMYYLIIVGVGVTLYFTRPREQFDGAVAALALGFFTCFAFYLIFPVEGPYWKFPRPESENISYFFVHVVRFILMGSAKGTAMPSGHCAISTVCWVSAWRYHLPLAIVYIFFVPGLIFATVWCGFHYGLDAGSGTLWGVLCGVSGILLAKYVPYVRPCFDSENYGDATNNKINERRQAKSM